MNPSLLNNLSNAAWMAAALLGLMDAARAAPAHNFCAATTQLSENPGLYGPGVALVEEQRGEPILSYQSGSITTASKHGIASCSKWLSGAIVLILAARGYFTLDDPIGKYLPVFAEAGKGHPTIRQCFGMTSGFYEGKPGYEIDRSLTLEESVDLIAGNVPLVFPPGTQLAYEGAGMQIAGRICVVVTGRSWHDLAADLLFRPLGMTQSPHGDRPGGAARSRSVGTSQDYPAAAGPAPPRLGWRRVSGMDDRPRAMASNSHTVASLH